MKVFLNKKVIIYFLVTLVIFSLDRISKIYVINIAEAYGHVDIFINDFLNIILIWNTGIGFGLLSFDQKVIYNLITIIIVIINFFIFYLIFVSEGLKPYYLILILGGSLGNLFDRIYYAAVPDFIDFNYNGFHWFIFNIADIFITLGIICLIFDEIIFNKKNKKNV
tara:strand:- start:121 stop:618 length:498 start_codon:yes stop_codon:yes gene_type:complete